jgi:hypothetical protein
MRETLWNIAAILWLFLAAACIILFFAVAVLAVTHFGTTLGCNCMLVIIFAYLVLRDVR